MVERAPRGGGHFCPCPGSTERLPATDLAAAAAAAESADPRTLPSGRQRDCVLAGQPVRRWRARGGFRRGVHWRAGGQRGELRGVPRPKLNSCTMLKLLRPGLHVKRWILILLIGMVVISIGIGYAMTEAYRSAVAPDWVGIATLQFLPLLARAALFLVTGVLRCVVGVIGMYRSLTDALPASQSLLERIYEYRVRQGGPR